MKTPLNSKVLILSLSALVLVGSGCERRGRAPVKAASAGSADVTQAGDKTTPIVDTKTDKKVTPVDPSNPATDTETNEVALERDAQLKACPVPAIIVTATPFISDAKDGKYEANSFQADLAAISTYWGCISKNGGITVLSDEGEKENKKWALSIEAARAEFAKLVDLNKDTNSDTALKVMKSRLEFALIQFNKFVTKYSDDSLRNTSIDSKAEFEYNQKTITVALTELDLQKVANALVTARPQIASLSIGDNANIADLGTDSESSENL